MAVRGERRRSVVATAVLGAALLAGAAGLTGCGSSTTGGAAPATTAARPSATTGTTPTGPATTWKVSLTSKDTRLHRVGPGEQKTYGWNLLTGSTTIDGRPAEVELLGTVDYDAGNGPWGSFLTVTEGDSSLGFRVRGEAALDPATKNTAFTGEMTVIGGTGRYAGASGTASVTGTRHDNLGGQVDFDVTMHVDGVGG
jgi:hypothetical protein